MDRECNHHTDGERREGGRGGRGRGRGKGGEAYWLGCGWRDGNDHGSYIIMLSIIVYVYM